MTSEDAEFDRRDIILFATVGGSAQPLISALETLRPAAVRFIVSDGVGGASSLAQVEDEEITVDSATGQRGPGLRRRPACPADCRVLRVPHDDPDRTFALCRPWLERALHDAPGARVIADYT